MPLSYPTLPGDIDHLIADDHAVVERMFQHLEANRGDRRTLVDQIAFELALHAFAEETVLYPMWLELGMAEANADARHEHGDMKELLVTLDKSEPGEPGFENALAELIGLVRHHVNDEEQEELPAFRAKVGAAKMAELGRQFLAAKRKAPPAAHPRVPDGGIAEKLLGALTKPLDQAKAAASGKKERLATDASGLLNPEAQAIVDAHSSLKPLPFETLEPDQARRQPGPDNAVKKVMAARGLTPEPVENVLDVQIPDAAGGEQTLRIYIPKTSEQGQSPVIMWIHGGGWVLFDIDTYDASCRGLANKTGAIVVSPNYRKAPEAVFPASHEDVLTAYRWTLTHIPGFGGDPRRVAIGGESVGGTMAAATCLQLAQAGEPVPAAQVCVYPLTTAEQHGESMIDAADARPLNRALLSWMAMHAFEGKRPEAVRDPRINLLGLTPEQLAMMPPTLVITDERDPLRSQGEDFAGKLTAAGVPTTHKHYAGVMHEFFGAAAVLKEAADAQQEAATHYKRAFTTHSIPGTR